MPGTGRVFVVAGGAGLIGSAVARALASDGSARVIVCDDLGSTASGKWANLPPAMDDLWPAASLIERLDRIWRDLAAVLVLADAGAAEGDADALFETAYHLPRRVWDVCAAKQRPILWASSSHVQGRDAPVPGRDPAMLAARRPVTALGQAHRAFELFAARNALGPDKPPVATALRLSSVYGPGEAHKGRLASLPARALDAARAGAPIELWRSTDPAMVDGGHLRDWVHADDAGAAIAHLALNGAAGAFDVGTGRAIPAHAVAQAAGRAASVQVRVRHVAPPAGAAAHDLPAADPAALRAAGFAAPMRDLEAGLADPAWG